MEPNQTDSSGAGRDLDEADLSWSELLAAYRVGRGQRTAAALLERLGPWLTNARKALAPGSPALDADDIAQELVVRVLARAAEWEPNCEDRWIPRRLVEPVERAVRQTLQVERRRATVELEEQLPAPDSGEPVLLFDTPLGRARAADLRLIYRIDVLGEDLEAVAKRARVTSRRMRQRIAEAKRRARS